MEMLKKSGKTWKTQENVLENKNTQGKLRENFYTAGIGPPIYFN